MKYWVGLLMVGLLGCSSNSSENVIEGYPLSEDFKNLPDYTTDLSDDQIAEVEALIANFYSLSELGSYLTEESPSDSCQLKILVPDEPTSTEENQSLKVTGDDCFINSSGSKHTKHVDSSEIQDSFLSNTYESIILEKLQVTKTSELPFQNDIAGYFLEAKHSSIETKEKTKDELVSFYSTHSTNVHGTFLGNSVFSIDIASALKTQGTQAFGSFKANVLLPSSELKVTIMAHLMVPDIQKDKVIVSKGIINARKIPDGVLLNIIEDLRFKDFVFLSPALSSEELGAPGELAPPNKEVPDSQTDAEKQDQLKENS